MKSTSKLSELFAPLFFSEEPTAKNSFLETICIYYLSLQAIHKRKILWFVITAKKYDKHRQHVILDREKTL